MEKLIKRKTVIRVKKLIFECNNGYELKLGLYDISRLKKISKSSRTDQSKFLKKISEEISLRQKKIDVICEEILVFDNNKEMNNNIQQMLKIKKIRMQLSKLKNELQYISNDLMVITEGDGELDTELNKGNKKEESLQNNTNGIIFEERDFKINSFLMPSASIDIPIYEKNSLIKVLRKEKKYVISSHTALNLSAKLSKVLHGDRHNGDDGYQVRSLYFDTVSDKDYYEKEDGLLCRQKIRFRIYSTDDQFVKLEKKEKEGDFQCKRSLSLPKEVVGEFISGNYERLLTNNEKFAEELYLDMITNCYVPKCIVEYNRKAFIVPENDIRITIDSNIRATECNFDIFSNEINCYPVCHPDDVTLEVKFNGFLLSYVKDLLDTCKKTQISNSKYCLARTVSKGKTKLF